MTRLLRYLRYLPIVLPIVLRVIRKFKPAGAAGPTRSGRRNTRRS